MLPRHFKAFQFYQFVTLNAQSPSMNSCLEFMVRTIRGVAKAHALVTRRERQRRRHSGRDQRRRNKCSR